MQASNEGTAADIKRRSDAYWKENIRLISILLVIWAFVSIVCAILSPALNSLIAGFPLGYYIGAQGAIIVFVVEIFYYSSAMDKLEKKYGLQEDF